MPFQDKEVSSVRKRSKSFNQELIDSRSFLKNIINHVADPIFVKDRQHRWIDGNLAFWKLMNKPEEEVYGKSDYEFFPKEQADIFWEKDEEVFQSGKENINIEYLTDSQGEMHILSTKKACFRGIDGSLILVGIIRDITEITRMEEQLKESGKAYLRGIIDNSLDAIVTIDQQEIITEWNKQAEAVFVWTHDEAIGKSMPELIIPPEYRERHKEGMRRFFETGAGSILGRRIELSGLNKQGKVFPIELAITAQKQFGAYYFTAFIRDITIRKQTEEVKNLLASIVESSDDAIFSITLDGTINSWNKGAQHLYGYSADEIMGKDVNILVPKELQEEGRKAVMQLLQGSSVERYESVRLHKDGHQIEIFCNASPVKDSTGKVLGASSISRDISDRKKAEKQLIKYTQALERSNKELDDFAYIASHDLKEPLRGIHNHSRFLMEDNKDKLDSDSVERLERLAYLSQHMERLINDLLYYSRLGRQKFAIQATDMNEVVHEIENLMDVFISENNAKIIISNPLPTVTCDKTRITEVFRNLITNAIKYNDKAQKTIEIGFLDKYQSPSSKIIKNVFYVKDNGLGIAKEFNEEIFRIFKRLQTSKNKEKEGTGVGLTFVKKIIEQHGGKIWLESELTKGTVFYFTLEE